MDYISELKESLNEYFVWNKARLTCFAGMLLSLMVTRTVNLTKLACVFASDAKPSSRYRRLQRFFAEFVIEYDRIALFIFELFFTGDENYYLTLDRTNWQWGKSDINILTLGITFKGTAIPIYWELLDKKGNSDTEERVALIQKFISRFGRGRIAGLLGDREFVGKKWFGWLMKKKIPFYIRIKNNTVTTNSRGLSARIDTLFYDLVPGGTRIIQDKRQIFGHALYLACLKLTDGKLLIVATTEEPENAIEIYARRWEIETLFGCLKGRGFHFEDTHITELERIKKLLVLLAIAFCWAHKTGEWRHTESAPIRLKKHGRPTVSLFRYGLDYIVEAIMKMAVRCDLFKECLQLIKPPNFANGYGNSCL